MMHDAWIYLTNLARGSHDPSSRTANGTGSARRGRTVKRSAIGQFGRAVESRKRWLLIAVVALLMSACRGPDPQSVGMLQPQPINAQSLAAGPGQDAAEPPPRLSLSDRADGLEPIRDRQVAPAQHTSPVPRESQDPATARAAAEVRLPGPSAPVAIPPSAVPDVVHSLVQSAPSGTQPCPTVYPQPCFPQTLPCGCSHGVPCGGWRPPGLPCPWPEDEFLCDGGDRPPAVRVNKDWSLDGLELEDTVVHYDTLDGDTHTEPSNRVCLYAPRFASVRKVYGIVLYDHLDRIARVDLPVAAEGLGDSQIATTSVQPVQPILSHGTAMASGLRERTPPTGLENRQGLVGVQGNVLPYEDVTDLQRKMLTNTEKARLADMLQAAAVWSHDAAVQVVIDNIATHEDVSTAGTGSVHIYSLEGKSRLRVCKLASRQEARPGETVEFTLQFENVGDQTIGNVTVIDNLTTRLEYVEDSENCSLNANFSSTENEGESLMLRWEIPEPLKAGEGGVIRFTCRVR